MKINRIVALGALLLAVACGEKDPYDDSGADDSASADDSATDDSAATDDSGVEAQNIEGSWLSEGEDVSDLLQLFNIASVTADFNGDGSYEVVSTDGDGAAVTYTGTYTVDVSTEIPTIVVNQTQPSETTAEGIWQVEGTTLKYEVIQTTPDIGYAPPTPESGFGSSSGPNLAAGANVQTFVAQ